MVLRVQLLHAILTFSEIRDVGVGLREYLKHVLHPNSRWDPGLASGATRWIRWEGKRCFPGSSWVPGTWLPRSSIHTVALVLEELLPHCRPGRKT